MRVLFVSAILWLFICCKPSHAAPVAPTMPPADTTDVLPGPTISYPDTPVTVMDDRMDELSGIAVSVTNPGIVYVHNDSGDSSRFFALSPNAVTKGTFFFNGDPNLKPLGVRDCEDMTVAPGPGGESYVYMGDIGDNDAVRKYITIYRMKEPVIPAVNGWTALTAEHLTLHYPDGPRDAETLMADPVDKLLYIISKREDSVTIYSTPLNFTAGDTVVLTKQVKLFFAGPGQAKWITGGSIAHDGGQILLKNYIQVFYWKRSAGTPVWKAMQSSPVVLPYTLEPQGEAIGFTVDGKGYYTISEGKHPKLYHYVLPH